MNFADDRRKSGRKMVDDRRNSGRKMVDDRRESGRKMVDDRRESGRKFRDDLRALAETEVLREPLSLIPARGARPLQRGVALWVNSPSGGGSGGGIDSPLIETDIALREYHSTGTKSSDGLFFIPAVKTIVMRDANDAEVVFEYAEPAEPVEP